MDTADKGESQLVQNEVPNPFKAGPAIWFTLASGAFAYVSERMDWPMFITLIIAALGVLSLAVALWKWSGRFEPIKLEARPKAGTRIQFVMVGMYVVVIFMAGVIYYKSQQTPDPEGRPWEDKSTIVFRKDFRNETVEIDHKTFRKSTFTNVTFVYRGVGVSEFIECQIGGDVRFRVTDKKIAGAFQIAEGLKSRFNRIEMEAEDPQGNVIQRMYHRITDQSVTNP